MWVGTRWHCCCLPSQNANGLTKWCGAEGLGWRFTLLGEDQDEIRDERLLLPAALSFLLLISLVLKRNKNKRDDYEVITVAITNGLGVLFHYTDYVRSSAWFGKPSDWLGAYALFGAQCGTIIALKPFPMKPAERDLCRWGLLGLITYWHEKSLWRFRVCFLLPIVLATVLGVHFHVFQGSKRLAAVLFVLAFLAGETFAQDGLTWMGDGKGDQERIILCSFPLFLVMLDGHNFIMACILLSWWINIITTQQHSHNGLLPRREFDIRRTTHQVRYQWCCYLPERIALEMGLNPYAEPKTGCLPIAEIWKEGLLHGDPTWNEDSKKQALITVLTNATALLPIYVSLKRNHTFNAVIGLMCVLTSTLYHLSESIEYPIFQMNPGNFHRLDNLYAIMACITASLFTVQSVTANQQSIQWTIVSLLIMLQQYSPWNIWSAIIPIIAAFAFAIHKLVANPALRSSLLGNTNMRLATLFFALSALFFAKGLDKNNDHLRIAHSMWHCTVSLAFYLLNNAVHQSSKLR